MKGPGRLERILLCLSMGTLFTHPLCAQEDLSKLTLEQLLDVPVVTATRQEEKSSSAPATVFVITEEQIRQRGYDNLEELLEDIPEVEIQRKSNHETWNHITMRGISGNEKFIVLMDGIRISSPTGDHHLVGTNYPLANAKRVEIILGPASALYGVDAFSGIIQILTKSGKEAKNLSLAGSYGRFQTTDNSFVYGQTFDAFSLAVTGQLYHSGEPFLPDFYPQEYAWYTNEYATKGLVRVSPFAPPDAVLQLPVRPWATPTNSNFFHARVNMGEFEFGYVRSSESHSTSVSVRPEFTVYSSDAIWQTTLDSLYGRYALITPSQKWKIQSTLSYTTHTLGTESKFINTFSSYQDAFKYGYGKDAKFEQEVSYFPKEGRSLILGFSFDDLNALPKTSDLPFEFDPDKAADAQGFYYLGTNVTDVNGNNLAIPQDFFYINYQNFGSYAQFQTRLHPNLNVTLGTRYDYNSRYGTSVNPRAGLVFSPTKKLTAKFLYGSSFRAPSPYDAYGHFGSFFPVTDAQGNVESLSSLFWRLPNPELKPERLRSVEGDLSYFLTNGIALSGDLYFSRISDLIVVQDTPDQYFKGILVSDVQTLVNHGLAHANGGTVRLDSLWKPGTMSFNFYGSYSYSSGDFSDDTLPFSARHTIKGGVDLSYRQWTLSTRLIHRSRSFHPQKDENGNNFSNEPFTVVNLFARYTNPIHSTTLHNSVFLRITNLTNAKYYNIRLEGSPASEFLATPQDPLRIDAGFTVEF